MMRWLAVVGLGLCSCAADEEEPPAPTACQRTDRGGTYLVHFERVSGSCPDLSDQLANVSAGGSLVASCELTSETWSNNDCTLETAGRCESPDRLNEFTMISRQQRQDGSVITATYGVRIYEWPSGNPRCDGVYQVTFTRQ